eukprot:CAMPEP_0119562668 /NCGR_PEP_ID=MMETSP1352-20130426/21193_1 /TAXON_ID=265584 /ORGANISM="Stauroneis constricta, Strain CCMP1120" /LENGTH=309 /DNA_ID=CAMNT_0007611117 /DNA_START=34 /DNA_END=963 /DNA_ORIENTATION=+
MKSPIATTTLLLLAIATSAAAFQQQQHAQSHHSSVLLGPRRSSVPASTLFTAQEQRRQLRQQQQHSGARSATSLSLSPAVITGAISGGLFAGGLHAIAGPDHLAALLPKCVGQRWYNAGRIGALWGMGHGVSATMLGVMAFGLKAQVQKAPALRSILSGASHVTEIAVGLSLIVIGAMGIREAREWEEEASSATAKSLSAAANTETQVKSSTKRAVIFNGLLHGFSWDGAPSLAPALAVATWGGNLAFLSSYAAGTMATMAITTTLIGEGTRRAGEAFQRPDIPQKLSLFSSILAIAIGTIWCGLAFTS